VGGHHFFGFGLDERVQLGLLACGRADLVEDWTLGQSNAAVLVFAGALCPGPVDANLANYSLVDAGVHVLRLLGVLMSCDRTHGIGCEI
jgi:hypothetical protein